MATDEQVARWLELLVQQTAYRNVQWNEIRRRNAYRYTASDGSMVSIECRDDDGIAPWELSVASSDGEITDYWLAFPADFIARHPDTDGSAPLWLCERIEQLWNAVVDSFAADPIANMLTELEQLPPF